jgi:hypothetical protein
MHFDYHGIAGQARNDAKSGGAYAERERELNFET